MKTLRTNLLGKKYLDQYSKITVKSIYKEVEEQLRKELLKIKLNGIEIVYSKANYGWYRKWFKCPLCHHRVFTLYNINGKLKCHKCSGLHYKSQKFNWMLEQKVYKNK